MPDPQKDGMADAVEHDFHGEADNAFESDITRFLCRRAGSRNWVEQDRAMVVNWAACVLREGGTVATRGSDYVVKASDVTMICRPHDREHGEGPK